MNEYLALVTKADELREYAREHPGISDNVDHDPFFAEMEDSIYDEIAEIEAEAEKAAWLNGLDEFLPD